jgi:inorganic pyrophosphatase
MNFTNLSDFKHIEDQEEILVFVEIAKNSNIKYEFNPELNAIVCDRILYTPFSFPFNYGFVPNTLSGDGDPLDVLIYMEQPLVPGSYIKCRIIGCLETSDEKGEDAKLIMVPSRKVSPFSSEINSINDLPKMFIENVIYFYIHYKDLENKEVKIGNILDKEEAIKIYKNSLV